MIPTETHWLRGAGSQVGFEIRLNIKTNLYGHATSSTPARGHSSTSGFLAVHKATTFEFAGLVKHVNCYLSRIVLSASADFGAGIDVLEICLKGPNDSVVASTEIIRISR